MGLTVHLNCRARVRRAHRSRQAKCRRRCCRLSAKSQLLTVGLPTVGKVAAWVLPTVQVSLLCRLGGSLR
jgi:hypothetical protein